jgi:hypothetical protein
MSQRLFVTSTFRRTACINHEQQSGSRATVNPSTTLSTVMRLQSYFHGIGMRL